MDVCNKIFCKLMAVRSGDDRQVCLRLLQRLASARRAIIEIYFPPIPWPMTLSPMTEAIRVKSCGKKPLVLGQNLLTSCFIKFYLFYTIVSFLLLSQVRSVVLH